VTVVGDDYQAIYGFRGAQPNVFQRFVGDYDHTTLQQPLQYNYRYLDPFSTRLGCSSVRHSSDGGSCIASRDEVPLFMYGPFQHLISLFFLLVWENLQGIKDRRNY
jgi:hypothetical protein